MSSFIYFKSDNYPDYIVRSNNGIMEDYKRGRGWAVNPERADILFGIDTNYTKITEWEAKKIIKKIEDPEGMNMKTIVIGGTFGNQGGHKSKIISEMFAGLENVYVINGGHLEDLMRIYKTLGNFDVICWFANVSNDMPKELRNIKSVYPDKIVIHSKRNTDGQYKLSYLFNHALKLKSNLLLEFAKDTSTGRITGRVFDPLAVTWCDTTEDFKHLAKVMLDRASALTKFTRSKSVCIGPAQPVPDMDEFFGIIKEHADRFHELINPDKEVTRFLGNASFRCQKGFPSFRAGENVFVSRRNIDKRFISKEGFVAVTLKHDPDCIFYYGENKPSVDTPVQIRLYNHYANVNFMLHSHVYIKGAPFTSTPIPCGALEESEEIKSLAPADKTDFCINLIGHGSLILAQAPGYLKTIEFYARPVPEILNPQKK